MLVTIKVADSAANATRGQNTGRDPVNLVPEQHPRERQIAILLFVLTCSYLYLFRRYTAMDPDEGIVLQGAQRILRGEVLYRDFFSFFTPGSYYFLALLFKIFGDSFLVARSALICFGGIYSAVTYLLARRVCSQASALLAAAIVSFSTLPYRYLVLHNWDSTLWACLAVYCAVRWHESARWNWAFGAGSFVSLTFLFEQSKGAGLGLGLGVGFAALALLDRELRQWKTGQWVGLAAGLAWPFVITLTYFGFHHSLALMLSDWFWPLRHYSTANRVSYGYQNWSDTARQLMFGSGSRAVRWITAFAVSPCFLVPVLPLLAVASLPYCVVQLLRNRPTSSKWKHYLLINATLSGLLLSVIVVRADVVHFMYLQPLFCLVLAWMLDGHDIPGRIFRTVRPVFVAYVAMSFLLFSIPLLLRAVSASRKIETRRGVIAVPTTNTDTVAEYVQAHVPPGGTILVYPYLPLYYYLTNTYSPSRYEYLQPGMNTVGQSAEVDSALRSGKVPVVLFELAFADKIPISWPGTPITAIAHDPIAESILTNYHSCTTLTTPSDWKFLYMVRKGSACP